MVLFVIIFFVTLLSLFFLLKPVRKPTRRPPGPPPLPLIGNLHQLDRTAPHLRLYHLFNIYGPIMSLKLGTLPVLIISSAKLAKEAITNHDADLSGRHPFKGPQKLSYGGLDMAFTTLGGPYWRQTRKICALHLFNPKKVRSLASILEDEVSKMVNDVKQHADISKTLNLSRRLLSLSSKIIFRVAFGNDYASEEFTKINFFDLLRESQAMLGGFTYGDYFPVIGDVIDRVSGYEHRLERVFQDLDSFYEMVIEEHSTRSEEKHDIVDVFLRLMGPEITKDHVKAVMMDMFIGGTDTTSATLTWAMTLLKKNPNVMAKLQKETRTQFKDKGFISEEDLHRLPYVGAVVKETMRLHPPLPLLIPRKVTRHVNISDYCIEPGTVVYLNVWAIGRDFEYWGLSDVDVNEFWPERFIGEEAGGKGFGLIPFGSGRRVCPGVELAKSVVELALANLVHGFDWELPEGMGAADLDTEVAPGVTMHKKVDLCLVPKICH